MFKNIDETLKWIQTHLPHGIKPGLQRMEWVMERLGHPERAIRAIHVGGTNGKGSTVSFLRSVLMETFEEVGTFTSPYIVDFNERISINNKPITNEELVEAANLIYPLAEELGKSELGYPTEFEVITMISLVYFSRLHPCDVVIYEVGLGGRLDSTNIIKPLLSVITNIGMDHVAILGGTIPQIAFEKAGIIKTGIPVVTTVENPEALEVIKDKASQENTKLYIYGKDFTATETKEFDPEFETFDYHSLYWHYKELKSALRGPHQIKNAAAALKTLEILKTYYAFPIEREAIYNGLKKVTWPGRFEEVAADPLTILDGAHNEEGVRALVTTLRKRYPEKNIHILFATLKERNNEAILAMLNEASASMTLTSFDFKRAESPENLLPAGGKVHVEPDWKKAYGELKERVKQDEVLLITGSLYFISLVRNFINK